MDQKLQSAALGREYVDLDPDTQLAKEEDHDTLIVYLPGFKKEQLRLQLTAARTLKITGERQLANTKWVRLQREYPVSTNSDTIKITAKIKDGILYIRQPKIGISPALKQLKETQASEGQKLANAQLRPQKPASEAQKPDQKPANDHPPPKITNDQETKSMSKEKEGKNSELVDSASVDKGDLEREKGEEEGKRNGKVDEDGKGLTKETLEGQESCGCVGGGAAMLMGKRRMRMVMNLVVGILLALVIGVYVRNWMKSATE